MTHVIHVKVKLDLKTVPSSQSKYLMGHINFKYTDTCMNIFVEVEKAVAWVCFVYQVHKYNHDQISKLLTLHAWK